MKNLVLILAGILLTGLLLSSCISPKKAIYASDLKQGMDTANIDLYTKAITIQIGDQLQLNLSALDKTQIEIFNPLSSASSSAVTGRGSGYTVNERGVILLPLVGEIEVVGLTAENAGNKIKQAISTYVKDPYVQVTIQNFKVTVIGAVGSSGIKTSPNDRMTILEAMAQSGDINPSALRDRVWVIRDNNGERTYAQINLNSKNLFKSDYYYLRNNDIVYVMPHPLTAYLGANAPVFATIGAVSGLLAIVLVLFQ